MSEPTECMCDYPPTCNGEGVRYCTVLEGGTLEDEHQPRVIRRRQLGLFGGF